MGKETSPSKVPLTIRTHPDSLERLRMLASSQNTTVSAIVDAAIEALLTEQTQTSDGISLREEDIEHFLPVIKAIGKPVTLSLFLKIIAIQNGG